MSSRLLLDEAPLVILPSLAAKIGLNEAIFIQQLHYWLTKSEKAKIFEGKRWIYNSAKQWREQFPFWSEKTIRRIVESLRKLGLIASKQLGAHQYNQVSYYTICYPVLESQTANRSGQVDQGCGQSDQILDVDKVATSLTETSSETKTDTSSTSKKLRHTGGVAALEPEQKIELDELWPKVDEFQGIPPKENAKNPKARGKTYQAYGSLFSQYPRDILKAGSKLIVRWLTRCQAEDLIPLSPKDRYGWVYEEISAALGLVSAHGVDSVLKTLNEIIKHPRFVHRLKSLRQYQSISYEFRRASS